jgi:hypothetical protein
MTTFKLRPLQNPAGDAMKLLELATKVEVAWDVSPLGFTRRGIWGH